MRDQYIGIDVHKAFFQACAVTPAGERLWEGRFPRTTAGMTALHARCTRHSALAVEASTPTWHFADALVGAVGEVRIVDPWKTKLKAGFAAKTDRLDARRLADALRRDSVVGIYYPPVAIREVRELCRARHALVQVRTGLINRRGQLCGPRPARRRERRPGALRPDHQTRRAVVAVGADRGRNAWNETVGSDWPVGARVSDQERRAQGARRARARALRGDPPTLVGGRLMSSPGRCRRGFN